MNYSSMPSKEAIAWQKDLRAKLFHILKMDDLVSGRTHVYFSTKALSSEKRGKYVFRDVEINRTPGRRIQLTITLPTDLKGPFPAVIAMPGHSNVSRRIAYEESEALCAYAHVLAEKGYVTLATGANQHEVYEESRTLMGERLWDVMRCLDFLESLDEVDTRRIGCAGLSFGGEMAMWLGAMDERIQATVSAGFLTRMDQLEQNHCRCWKFAGLRDLGDFSDIYSMIAPRPLLCQNGWKERPTGFTVPIAREAMKEIKVIYTDMKCPENVSLVAHDGGHVIDRPSLLAFLDRYLVTPYAK